MAEVYVKIRSQTPEETFQKFKVLKRIYAFMYSALIVGFILKIVTIFKENRIITVILLLMLVVIAFIAIYSALKYILFFSKLKIQNLKLNEKFSCKKVQFLILPGIIFFLYIVLLMIVAAEFFI